jgi:hypothetical protein
MLSPIEQLPALPAASTAVTVMVRVPNPTIVLPAGLRIMLRAPTDVQLSVAATPGKMFAMIVRQLELAEFVSLTRQITTGLRVPLTVTVKPRPDIVGCFRSEMSLLERWAPRSVFIRHQGQSKPRRASRRRLAATIVVNQISSALNIGRTLNAASGNP